MNNINNVLLKINPKPWLECRNGFLDIAMQFRINQCPLGKWRQI